MALEGRVVLEDVVIEWTDQNQPGIELQPNTVFVKVAELQPDGSWKRDSFVATGREFMNAMATAIAWDGDVPATAEAHAHWWKGVESVAAISKIRFMP